MDSRIYNLKHNRFIVPLGLSILFHILLLLLYLFWGAGYFNPKMPVQKQKSISVEFLRNRPRSREVVETPENARIEKPPEKADLASDKNAYARDMNKDRNNGTEPFSQGISDVRELAKIKGSPVKPAMQGKNKTSGEKKDNYDQYATRVKPKRHASDFSKNVLLGRMSNQYGQDQEQVPYKQTKTSADDVGGISFNTYNWNFAPYLLELKKRIQRNIYPPPAFTRLGFGGENIIKFRIYPDGRLEALSVLKYNGEEALVETSRKAVEMSAPFMPLPEDFPEKFLEVTANFRYYIMNY